MSQFGKPGLFYLAINRLQNMARLFFILTLLCLSSAAGAQQKFEEGVIVYSVSIGPLDGGSGYSEHAGTYTITLKDAYVRKDLEMNSGYSNIILENRNTGTVYSLRIANGQRYAIQLRNRDLDDKLKPYRGFSESVEPGTMMIAGQNCKKARIHYRDGSSSILYYSTAWMSTDSTLFDRFPGFKYIPLTFEYRSEEGITMRFTAEKLEQTPVENSIFRVPPGYRIISNADYKAISR